MAREPRGIRSKPNTLEHLSLVNCLTGLGAWRDRERERGIDRGKRTERGRWLMLSDRKAINAQGDPRKKIRLLV